MVARSRYATAGDHKKKRSADYNGSLALATLERATIIKTESD